MANAPWPYVQENVFFEQNLLQKCHQFGIPYPPNSQRVLCFILEMKMEAEKALKQKRFEESLQLYNRALMSYSVYPGMIEIKAEQHKLLCNRSLVLEKMRFFKEAVFDAKQAIEVCPTFLKGYWRAFQAVKGGYNGVQRAMQYLIEGLRRAMLGQGDDYDIVSFLVEVCKLIQNAPKTETLAAILVNLVVPKDTDVSIWVKVIQNLANGKHWECVSMLLLRIPCPPKCTLEFINASSWKLDSINLGLMFEALSDDKLKKWGEALAVCLSKQGSSVERIGQHFGKPILHYVVELSLRIDSTNLLKHILEEKYCGTNEVKKNDQDSNGCTVLHIFVKSGKVNTEIGVNVLKLLLEHKCNAGIKDQNNKKPIEYLKLDDTAYSLLYVADKSVDDLRSELETLKIQGNKALKEKNHQEALTIYNAALNVSQQSKQLYKEAAILYSNRANVFYNLMEYESALTNALAAISSDSKWHKGYWWCAKTLHAMGSQQDAFAQYLEGYLKSEGKANIKHRFLNEAVPLLKQIPDEHFMVSYNELKSVDVNLWPSVLVQMSKAGEWKCIAYLLLGQSLNKARFENNLKIDNIESLCVGVAGKACTSEVLTNTVFQYLSQNDIRLCSPWLDATLLAVYAHGGVQTLQNFVTDQNDCPLHAAVRFALLTGRTSLLEVYPVKDPNSGFSNTNHVGDSVFHAITKFHPVPAANILAKVIKLMITTGLSTNTKDGCGKLPVEYLDRNTPDDIVELFVRAKQFTDIEDINQLKDKGILMYKKGEYRKAIELYTKALELSLSSGSTQLPVPNRDIAVLSDKRAECYMKVKQFHHALNDALQSIYFDRQWYKGHFRVGQSYKTIGQPLQSVTAFINAYCLENSDTDRIKVEILEELSITCAAIPRKFLDVKTQLPNFPPGQGHVWAQACYELVCKNYWNYAAVAYFQYSVGNSATPPIVVSLKPFCNKQMLMGYPWGLDMMQFFLKCGSDRHTISLDKGDTYLHAVVKMTLTVARNYALLEYIVDKYCKEGGTDQHQTDNKGNTILHVATLQKAVNINTKYDVIMILLKCTVNPNIQNKKGHTAIKYLQGNEKQSIEVLRKVMSIKESSLKKQQTVKTTQLSEVSQPHQSKPNQKSRRQNCQCEKLLKNALSSFDEKKFSEGYGKLTELMSQKHTGSTHKDVLRTAIAHIVNKLGETDNPEIPKCLTSVGDKNYLMIVEGLASSNKWRQLDMVVHKYRTFHGSDQLMGFAANLTVEPVIKEPCLKGEQDVKLQIICNLLNSGGSLGSDNGQAALKYAVDDEHFKVVEELIKRGADTSALSMYDGDTPIHAALVLVLNKHTSLHFLQFLLDLYVKDPKTHQHLTPEQADKNGDCLFHIVAKAKYSLDVLKIVEVLCKRNISANYYNNDGKFPIDYILKKDDRRLNYLRLARTVKPSRQQIPKSKEFAQKLTSSVFADKKLNHHPIELSVREIKKERIEEMIRLLPDSKFSIFNVDQPPSENQFQEHVGSGDLDRDVNLNVNSSETLILQTPQKANVLTEVSDNISWNNKLTVELESRENQWFDALVDKESQHNIDKDSDIATADAIERSRITTVAHKVVEKDVGNRSVKVETAVESQVVGEDLGVDGDNVIVMSQSNDQMLKEKINNSEDDDDYTNLDKDEQFQLDIQVFDNLDWEVVCTTEVWKTLCNMHIPIVVKQKIIHKIQLLASGDWQPHLCKELKDLPPTLKLFEAKINKGSRILWELAVEFSPRCSESAEHRLKAEAGEISRPVKGGRIYSEIIRLWEILLDHDKIDRSVQRIKKSHLRGETCLFQKTLTGSKNDRMQMSSVSGRRYPLFFAEKDLTTEQLEQDEQGTQCLYPPASPNETEYHILKFYTFSSALVNIVLQNINIKVDFPFRVTDLEHAIVHLKSKAPILLLGRSGTGKTTCCMYRLWSQFHSYWSLVKESDDRLLPRCVEFKQEVENGSVKDAEEGDDSGGVNSKSEKFEESSASLDCDEMDILNSESSKNPTIYDHLCQIFITKNPVLCKEVQKSFCELSHADELMAEHVQHENDVLPSRLQDVHEFSFPLFLTSRQLLLMLDASIGPPYFFERKDDGSLKADIAGWSDIDDPLNILTLLHEDSDVEEEMEEFLENEDIDEMELQDSASKKKLKTDPRREVTYTLFVKEIWPRLQKGAHTNYHPSLIWEEIMSFIKGSYEALSDSHGYLLKDDYIKLGKKRAPNFTGERDVIYDFFEEYQRFRRKQMQYFDETDLVHDVFWRLNKMVTHPWAIHQIFVDETQDFTQAELSLLIQLCQNPNEMFLTGDTAQGIMRGISFRFIDLKSLFFHANQSMEGKGKQMAIEVPKQIYQLTHNYRSHAGILSLATSVLDLMVEFFPESFDRLQPDQGLFPGPQPILLESCSFSDLAVLLRGNKRKTSHIEFGAHQAILVVNDLARKNIPEELQLGLVLTIYESKGLEFDDVLLYNFFKDSQAFKEWRVVTEFLERLAEHQREKTHRNENLVKIDEYILEEQGRPRALNFDANQHKVLNSELKHLYTAITRARVNVWIFDEHVEKRAPMFEYFKARQLVKSLHVEEINEACLSEAMFAEKSSSEDWLQRGKDFMRHALYGVAAKCFEIGGDVEQQLIAIAHERFLTASRMRANPREMREEFMNAAELFMDSNKPHKAAICLQNAKEHKLAAELFEKLGQFDRAADMYKKMKLPWASSRCYEQLGNFNKAMEVLWHNEMYDEAIDTLKRYNIMMEDLQKNGKPIPPQLIGNAPEAFYTEENLSHRAAEVFHKCQSEKSMLNAVEKFQNVNDRVEFLKKRNYILHAAKILQDHGQVENAAELLLLYGHFKDAENMARKTSNTTLIARCLLVKCRVLMSKQNKQELSVDDSLLCYLNESLKMFQTCNECDGIGEVRLLLGKLSGDMEHIKFAWKAFKDSKPFVNEAGLVECCEWMVKSRNFENVTFCRYIVQCIRHILNVCNILLKPNSISNVEKVQKLHSFYGLNPQSQDKLAIFPKSEPHCLLMIEHMLKAKTEQRISFTDLNKTEVYENMVAFLLKRTKNWIKKAMNALIKHRDSTRVCANFHADLECPHFQKEDKSCRMLHAPQTDDGFKELIEIDLILIEFESNAQMGVALLMKNILPKRIIAISNEILKPFNHLHQFQTCKYLWDDIMPAAGHSMLIRDSRSLINYLRTNYIVQDYLRQWLLDKWAKSIEGEQSRILKCSAVRETDVFLVFEFGYHFFGFDTGQMHLDRSPSVEMRRFENELDQELANKGQKFKSRANHYTLMMAEDENRELNVECVARRFTDAYAYMSCNEPDPFEAVVKFNKFMKLLNIRSNVAFYPEMKNYLMWVEFYTTLAIFLIAKIKTVNKNKIWFILPSNFLALVEFIEETFPDDGTKFSVSAIVDWWEPHYRDLEKLMERLKYITFGISGQGQNIHIPNELVKLCKTDPTKYVLIERLWILEMTLICNGGNVVPVECEIGLVSSIRFLQMPKDAPPRLKLVQSALKQAKGVSDVAHVLMELLKSRQQQEKLLVCNWRQGERKNIDSAELQKLSLFSEMFLNPNMPQTMYDIDNVTEQTTFQDHMDTELTEDEIQKGKMDKKIQVQEMVKNRAALLITKCMKAVVTSKMQQHTQKVVKNTLEEMFSALKVDTSMCGICGINFEQKLKEKLEYERSTIVQDKAVLNQKNVNTDEHSTLWTVSQENANDTDNQTQFLSHIRASHIKELSHIEKCIEFNNFRCTYREDFAPKLQTVKDFVRNSHYKLTDVIYREKHYDHYLLEIERMIELCNLIEKELHMLMVSKMWSTTAGKIKQNMIELMKNFDITKPYIDKVNSHIKQEDKQCSNQASTMATATKVLVGENLEDEDIEPFVEELEQKKPLQRKAFSKAFNRGHNRLNIGPRYYKNADGDT